MLLTGKKLWLTSLVLILSTKLVNACSIEPESNEQVLKQLAERDFSVKIYFFFTVLLIAANIALFFVRKKNDYLLGFAIILTALISAPITMFSIVTDSCGDSIVEDLRINFYIFLSFLVFQVCLWLKRAGLRFNQEKPAVDFP
jgi:surface polysaccharide O-acyltransferase-like enzyme